MGRFSLSYRIAAVIIVLQAFTLVLAVWQSVSRTTQGYQEQLDTVDRIRMNGLAELARGAFITGEYDDAMATLRNLKGDQRIMSADIVDLGGRVVASTNPLLLGHPALPRESGALWHWRTTPVMVASQVMGEVAVRFSDADLAAARSTAWRQAGAIGGAGLLVTIAISLLLGRLLTRRFDNLVVATQRLAAGDSEARARLGGRDEIARLGHAFDDMAGALQERVREMIDSRARLAEQEALLRTVIEMLPVGVFVIGTDGKILTGNQQAREIWGGMKHVGIEDYGDFKAWWPDTGKRIEAHEWGIARALRAGERSFNEIIDIESFDGTRKSIAYWSVPLRDAEGRITGAVAVNQDVTERERAEEARLGNERRLQSILDTMFAFVGLFSPEGVVVEANRAPLEAAGLARDDVIGKPFAETYWWSYSKAVQQQVREALRRAAEGEVVRDDFVVRIAGEQFITVDATFAPLKDASGRVTQVVGSGVDITGRKRAEEARAKLEAQLRQAQKMEALGTLAGGIAHDFNNMLAAIIGNVELARQDVGAHHPAQKSLVEIGKASARARDLVRQILTFSRQQPQERRVIELREVAEESVKLLRATLPAGIELVATFAAGTPNVLADRTQIHQVLMNLCANAWHAMEGKAGRIEVALAGALVNGDTAHPDLRSGRYARLTVTDTGKGMDVETVGRIFDPFFTTRSTGEGTGLGLAVVDGIVKTHDGAITVYSEPGRGTVFHLYFPAVETQAEALPLAPSSLSRGSGQRILYLDDEKALVELATRLLERLGYEVKGYTRADEALAAFQADPGGFDLVVTDLNMPGASGLEVAGEVLRLRPELPVVLTSGYLTEELSAKARALGIREIIYKPSTVEELVNGVHRFLAEPVQPGNNRPVETVIPPAAP